MSPLLVVLDKLSPPPILPPASVVPLILYRLHINYRLCALPRVPRRRAEARPGRYGGLLGIPRPADRPIARLGGRCFLLPSTQWTGCCEISADHRVESTVPRGILDDE